MDNRYCEGRRIFYFSYSGMIWLYPLSKFILHITFLTETSVQTDNIEAMQGGVLGPSATRVNNFVQQVLKGK